MNASRSTNDLSAPQLCRWLAPYAWRRRFELAIVVATMLVRIGLDLLKPWPMVFLVDYVLQGKTTSAILPSLADLLPGPHSPGNLIGWSVGATVLIFLFSWAVGVANAYANISLGQRMVYDLAADLFEALDDPYARVAVSGVVRGGEARGARSENRDVDDAVGHGVTVNAYAVMAAEAVPARCRAHSRPTRLPATPAIAR